MNPLIILLPILVSIVGGIAVLPLKFQEDRSRNIYCETVVCLTSLLVFFVLLKSSREVVEVYSFTRGFTVSLRVDGMSCLFAAMISLMWPLVMLYAFSYMEESKRKNMFFAFFVMTFGVTLGICFAANMTTLYVFYEMLTLVTLPLVVHYEDHESMYAGRKYAAYTIGGAALAFFAVVTTTMETQGAVFVFGGSLDLKLHRTLELIAYMFAFFGFGVKAAIFPLHDWLPTASAAPTPVTALLHAVAVVNSGVFAVIRLTWYVYRPSLLKGTMVHRICLVAAIFTLVYAAVLALKERHFKRKLAYSTVSNLSYMLFGVMLLTEAGLQAGLSHMLFHGIIKITLFMCAGAFMHVTGNEYVYEVNGVGKRMPVTFICYTLGALSLTGIPLFCGFVSKWKLLMAGADAGTVWSIAGVIALIVSAFLCAMYTLPISVRAFFPVEGKDMYADKDACKVGEAPVLMLIPIVVFSIVNVLFGVWSGPIMAFLGKIAAGTI